MKIVSRFLLLALLAISQAQAGMPLRQEKKSFKGKSLGKLVAYAALSVAITVVGTVLYRRFFPSLEASCSTNLTKEQSDTLAKGARIRLTDEQVAELFKKNPKGLWSIGYGKIEATQTGWHIECCSKDNCLQFYWVSDTEPNEDCLKIVAMTPPCGKSYLINQDLPEVPSFLSSYSTFTPHEINEVDNS